MYANEILDKIVEVLGRELTIGEALALKNILGLTDSEAISIFLGA